MFSKVLLSVLGLSAVAACDTDGIKDAMTAAGLEDTYELLQSRDVFDSILASTGRTILVPDFTYTPANSDEFTIEEVDAVLDDGDFTLVLLRGVLDAQYTYEYFDENAPNGSPASDDTLEFEVLSTLDPDEDVTFWHPEDSDNIYFRTLGADDSTGTVNLLSTETIEVCGGDYTLFAISGPLLTIDEAATIRAALAPEPAED